ncbi:hypothetical protein ACJX0J_041701, partial [Zea mays]
MHHAEVYLPPRPPSPPARKPHSASRRQDAPSASLTLRPKLQILKTSARPQTPQRFTPPGCPLRITNPVPQTPNPKNLATSLPILTLGDDASGSGRSPSKFESHPEDGSKEEKRTKASKLQEQ